MKKLLGLFVAVLCVCLVTGCGKSNNTITCTQTEDGQEVVATVTTDKDDKITAIEMKTTMEASSKEELNTTLSFLNLMTAMYEEEDGIDVKISSKDLKVTLVMKIDLSKVSDEQLDDLDIISSEIGTGAEFKKNAEEDGATCK